MSDDPTFREFFKKAKENSRKNGKPYLAYLFLPLLYFTYVAMGLANSLVDNPLPATIFFTLNILFVYFPQVSSNGRTSFIYGLYFFCAILFSIYLIYLKYSKGVKFSATSMDREMQPAKSKFSILRHWLYIAWISGIILTVFLDLLNIYAYLLKVLHR